MYIATIVNGIAINLVSSLQSKLHMSGAGTADTGLLEWTFGQMIKKAQRALRQAILRGSNQSGGFCTSRFRQFPAPKLFVKIDVGENPRNKEHKHAELLDMKPYGVDDRVGGACQVDK